MRDLTYSARALLRHPRYTLLAVATLAVGIGVTAAMFGLLDALFFRPLPVAEAHRLVDVHLTAPQFRFRSFSYLEFKDIERSGAFKDVFAIGQRGVTMRNNGDTQQLLIHYVTGRYFPTLAIPMHLGRGFADADDSAAATTPQVVINHHLWLERLGGPPDIIGRTIQLNETAFTVIGVTAAGFVGLQRPVRTDVWIPATQAPFVVRGLRDELENRKQRWFHVVGRLSDGTDVAHAGARLDVVMARWRTEDAKEYEGASIVPTSQEDGRRETRQQGVKFLALVALVLLIACANVANLTLARGEGRRKELALRSALGASRAALLRQMLIESALVTSAATGIGLLLATWIVFLMPSLLPPGSSMLMLDVRIDTRMLAFAGLLAIVATGIVGLLPALRASRARLTDALKGNPPRAGWHGPHLRDVLVVGEIALSGVILVAAGLTVRSLGASLAIAPGFDMQKSVATFYVVPALKGYTQIRTHEYFERARQAALTVPGVTRASYGIRLPAQGNEAGWSVWCRIPGHEPPAGKEAFEIRYTMVGPGYFEVMGTRILQGRGIDATDMPTSAPVAVISQTMARRFWPDQDPIGQTIRMGRTRTVERQIVGVAEDIRISGLYEAPEMYLYVPYAQQPQGFGLLLVETRLDAASVIAPVKQRLADIDANVPVLHTSSIADHASQLLYEDRRNAWIGLAVAILALVLGAVGVYGVVSLATARRTREIGIRVALGAARGDLLRLLLGRGVAIALIGAALGIAGGIWAGHALKSELHGVEPVDALSLACGTLVLIVVAIAASFVPAWRASRVDPSTALRQE